MIVGIHGILEGKSAEGLLVRVGGFTLMVHTSATTLSRIGGVGTEIHLFSYLQAKENNLALYGFATEGELKLFHTLLGVSGVGPRTALSLLSSLSPEQLAAAVARGDAEALSQAFRVGKRLAERLVVELKGKLEAAPAGTAPASGDEAQVISALTNLGYSPGEASRAVAVLPTTPLPLAEKIRLALQHLAAR